MTNDGVQPSRGRGARAARGGLTMAALLLTMTSATGCSTAIKRVYYEFRGAKAKVHPTGPVSPGAFDRFNSIAFAPATTESGRLCPPELLAAYDSAAEDAVAASDRTFPGGPPTLRIESEMLYFQGSGVFKTALCLIRVKMFDEARPVLQAVVAAESKSVTRNARGDLPQACAKAIGEYLARRRARDGGDEDSDAEN